MSLATWNRDIYATHHYEPDAVHAVRDGLEAGCDIDSGTTYSDNVAEAVSSGLVDKQYSDAALFRSYKMRYKLGLFDPNVSSECVPKDHNTGGWASSLASHLRASLAQGRLRSELMATTLTCRALLIR